MTVSGGGGIPTAEDVVGYSRPQRATSVSDGVSSTTRKLTSRDSSSVHVVAFEDAASGAKPLSVSRMMAVASSSRPARVRRVASAIQESLLL